MRSNHNRENPRKDIQILNDGRIRNTLDVKKQIIDSGEKMKKEHENALNSVKKEKEEDTRKSVIPLTDPSIPFPWRAYLSMRKMRCYYHNHDTKKSYWEREEVDKWKRENKFADVKSSNDEPMDMSNFDIDDITCIKAIRSESGHVDLHVSVPRKSGHLNLSTESIAIFDTSALIDLPEILDITVRNKVIAVIPYKVVQELDGLKKSGRVTVAVPAAKVHESLDDLSQNNNPMLILESGRELNEPLEGFVVENADDKILKCALKIMEFMGDHMRNIWFVTNDRNLRLKARGFVGRGRDSSKLQAAGSQVFVNGLLKERSEKKKEYREKKKEKKNEVKGKGKEKEKHNKEEDVIWIENGHGIEEKIMKKNEKLIVKNLKIMDDPSSSKNGMCEMKIKDGSRRRREKMEVIDIEDEDYDYIEIIENSHNAVKKKERELAWDEYGEEEDSDDEIIEVNAHLPEIPDEVWDEYMRPSQVFFEILSKTPPAIYAVYSKVSLNIFIRDKAYKDLHSIREGIVNISADGMWTIENFMSFFHFLHSLHRYYVVRSPFPPQKLSQTALTDDLAIVGIDKVQSSICHAFQMINSFSPVEDGSRFNVTRIL